MTTEQDNVHIEQILTGNKEAFALLVDKYKQMVFTLALNLMQQREEAEEVAQDAFLKAYQSLSKFRGKSKFSTWLYRIVYNECITQLRKKKNVFISLEDQNSNFFLSINSKDDDWGRKELQIIELKKALQKLKETEKTIILLYYYEDLKVNEIASIIGISESNVKIKLYRTRKKLYAELLPVFDFENA